MQPINHNNIYSKKDLFLMFDRIKESIKDKPGEYFIHIRTKLEDIDIQTTPKIAHYLDFLKTMLNPLPDLAGVSFEFIMRPYEKDVYEIQSKITKEILDANAPTKENSPTSHELHREDQNGKEGDSSTP